MRRSISISFAFILLVGVAWYFLGQRSETFQQNTAFSAIPTKTPLVVEIPEFGEFLEDMEGNNPIINEAKQITELNSFWLDVNNIRSITQQNAQLRKVLDNKDVLIAFNAEGKNNIGELFAFNLRNQSESDQLISAISGSVSAAAGTITQKDYSGVTVYSCQANEKEYHFASQHGIFLFSKYVLFVEEAIRQIEAENLLSQQEFNTVYNKVSTNSSFNIFINHEKINQFVRKLSTSKWRSTIDLLSSFASWTELNAEIREDGIFMEGQSSINDLDEKYLTIIKKQEAQRSDMDEMLPANTSLFINLNISDYSLFQTDFEEYLKKQGTYYNRETKLTQLDRYSKDPFKDVFESIAGKSFALAFGQVLQNQPTANRYFIAEVNSRQDAIEALQSILSRYANANKLLKEDTEQSFVTPNENSYTIYTFPFKNIAELLFGKLFASVDCNFLCFYDDYLVFADNISALKEYIEQIDSSKTLQKDDDFQDFNRNMASSSNIYFYLNIPQTFSLGSYYLQENLSNSLLEHEKNIQRFYGLGWQVSSQQEEIQNTVFLKYNPVKEIKPQLVWQTKLDADIIAGPKIVKNHTHTSTNEVILQDEKNKLYLLNNNGEINWSIELPAPILGNIHQVDTYRNGKYQYLFNTKDQLYLIDINGGNVADFPIQLSSAATNGVSVFDYDNSRNYRYFIACEDKQIHVYNSSGKVVTGWNSEASQEAITKPIKHFRLDSKDFIVTANKSKTFILNRQGNVRIETNSNVSNSGNEVYLYQGEFDAFATTSSDGKVQLYKLDGTVESLDLGKYSSSHYFNAEDINSDGKTELIIADEDMLYAFTYNGRKLFELETDDNISACPQVYSTSDNSKVILVSDDDEQIYLVNPNGTLYNGFPVKGNKLFELGYMNSARDFIYLFSGNEDESVISYKIQAQ